MLCEVLREAALSDLVGSLLKETDVCAKVQTVSVHRKGFAALVDAENCLDKVSLPSQLTLGALHQIGLCK